MVGLYRNHNHGCCCDARCSMGHLKKVKRGYWSHAGHASRIAFLLIRAGMAGMVHAFVPVLYTDKMSKSVAIAKHVIWQDDQRIRRNG